MFAEIFLRPWFVMKAWLDCLAEFSYDAVNLKSIDQKRMVFMLIESNRDGFIKIVWSLIMKFADGGRRLVMNLLFLLVLFFIVTSILGGIVGKIKDRPIEKKTALVLNFNGPIVEESTQSPQDILKNKVSGSVVNEIVLRDILRTIEYAQNDEHIDRIVMVLDDFEGASLAILIEIGRALQTFRESGKEVISFAAMYDQTRYLLAAHGSEILMDPMGGIFLTGFGRYREYYKDAFSRLGIKAHVIQTGDYKNFAENFSASAPSRASVEAERYLFDDLWASYLEQVELARGLESGAVTSFIQNFLTLARDAQFDSGQMAFNAGMVDDLVSVEEFRLRLIERGEKFEHPETKVETFRQISFGEYMKLIPDRRENKGVAIMVAQGPIHDGNAGPGVIGGRSLSEQIRQARFDKDVDALVLRVVSPGGSAFASELIRREVELFRETGRPVVISMGSVAASGGYWISMSNDLLVADETTITGSIGVVGLLFNAEEAMKKLSINIHGQSTTWLGEAMPDPRRPLDPRFVELIKGMIHKIYQDFLGKASASRGVSADELKVHAEGRVWTGRQALERGLIDELGGIDHAVTRARELAKLTDDSPVFYWERKPSRFEKILEQLQRSSLTSLAQFIPSVPALTELQRLALRLGLSGVLEQGEAYSGPMAHCFCDADFL
jgi:protease IV